MKSILLKPEEVKYHLEEISQWIEKALKFSAGERTRESLMTALCEGKAQCWCVMNETEIVNVTVTEIIDFPNKRVLHIVTSAGQDWEDHKGEHSHLEEFAKMVSAESITVWGRKGWERKLPSIGYEHIYSVFEKKL